MNFDFYTNQMSQQQSTTSSIISLVFYVLAVIALWRIFAKAGRPGWLAIIPIINVIVLVQVSGHSGWSVLLFLIPIVGLVWTIVVAVHLAQSFGKSGAFGVFLLWLFTIIGYLILGFDSSTYRDRRSFAA
ncbi:hypothetical protein F1C58_14510 [Glaciihabitans sp. INWT7]|uniref:DUF5684 domain-containing protein n=1 Tax=Glaciihabitans sp. INWT7 TaxID=2596912 RepID=UPI00162A3099|nr:DUF5684 domain-containing protein [Glaciihabitans sp. INWT7]QNE47990.1 hypothetical protein F1C58_14510 [Glaciihabitans sp. INWT7]